MPNLATVRHGELLGRAPVSAILAQLTDAFELEQQTEVPPGTLAVELTCLLSTGGTGAALRWLVESGLVQHLENWPESACCIDVRQAPFKCTSRFSLSFDGLQAVQRATADRQRFLKPSWNPERRQLRLDGQVVKLISAKARNQILVVTAFEEEHWPPVIDDPLPLTPGVHAPKRLRNTIQRLNLGMLRPRVRFHANGTGDGIRWELR